MFSPRDNTFSETVSYIQRFETNSMLKYLFTRTHCVLSELWTVIVGRFMSWSTYLMIAYTEFSQSSKRYILYISISIYIIYTYNAGFF